MPQAKFKQEYYEYGADWVFVYAARHPACALEDLLADSGEEEEVDMMRYVVDAVRRGWVTTYKGLGDKQRVYLTKLGNIKKLVRGL